MFGNFSNAELDAIIDAVKWSRAQLVEQNAHSFRKGDTVKFTDRRRRVTFTGTVDSVKIKFALVNTSQGRFNVPLNMLEAT